MNDTWNTSQHTIIHRHDLTGRKKEGNVLFNDALNTLYFTGIWRQT